jgi:general secretion pathway protein E
MQWHRFPDPGSEDFLSGFGNHLQRNGCVDVLGLQRAQRAARQSGERFDHVLTTLGLISDIQICEQLAGFLGIGICSASDLPEASILSDALPETFVTSSRLLPIIATTTSLTVAIVDPFASEQLEAVRYATGLSVVPCLITPSDFEKAVARLYSRDRAVGGGGAVDDRTEAVNETDLQRLKDIANEAPIIRHVNLILAKAIEARASDVHIEPGLDAVHVRYRIDGVLRDTETISLGLKHAIASRIKIMSRLDIAERRLPQDGRTRIAVRGVDIDFRVSTLPTAHGESIVMRILDKSTVSLDFTALGFESTLIRALRELTRVPNGIILVTGPTGSGKTTTLYTALKELNRADVKILTVEDPIEYQLARTNQVQVQPAIGLDFPHALRSILRQDPDVIMIGEIRDAETARIAVQASLTGHLVFSTLHTNSAASSITRLIDMGVESYLIASTVKAVLAQRLVRRLCPHCAVPSLQDADLLSKLRASQHNLSGGAFKKAVGCRECSHTGYRGRSTIAELLTMTPDLQRLVSERASEDKIENAARAGGMIPLSQAGLVAAWQGITSVEEVSRVAWLN